jgi:hypothetical protein
VCLVLGDSYHLQGRLEEALLTIGKAFRVYVEARGPDDIPIKSCERRLIELTQERDQLQRSQLGASLGVHSQDQHQDLGDGPVLADLGLSSDHMGEASPASW